MIDHYRHKDMHLENIFLGMYKISTQKPHLKLDLRYSICCRLNYPHLILNRFRLVFRALQPNTFLNYEIDRLLIWLSKQGRIDMASSFPCFEEYSLYQSRFTLSPLCPETSQITVYEIPNCSSEMSRLSLISKNVFMYFWFLAPSLKRLQFPLTTECTHSVTSSKCREA